MSYDAGAELNGRYVGEPGGIEQEHIDVFFNEGSNDRYVWDHSAQRLGSQWEIRRFSMHKILIHYPMCTDSENLSSLRTNRTEKSEIDYTNQP